MNFLCKHLYEFVFVETTALPFDHVWINFCYVLYKEVEYMNNS